LGDALAKNGGSEQDPPAGEQQPQMVHHPEFHRHAPWQAVEHIGQSDTVNWFEAAGRRGQQIRLAHDRPVPGEALARAREATAIKQREIIEPFSVGAVDEDAGADASFKRGERLVR
jgi:hypothetical protein